jgi:hypothetical protein
MIKVWTDIGAKKPVPLLAKIVEVKGPVFIIRYLQECDDKIWRYEEDVYEIDEDSIQEDLCTAHETDVGFRALGDGFIQEGDVSSDDENNIGTY